jgi:nucleoporin SEH1
MRRGTEAGTGGSGPEQSILSKRKTLDGEAAFVDVRFAPSEYGLKLAAVTADGRARLFECEQPLTLASWTSEDLEPTNVGGVSATDVSDSAAMSTTWTTAALDWMPAPFGGCLVGEEPTETLAIAGRGGRLAIWSRSPKTLRWVRLEKVDAHSPEAGGVKDVAWCPNLCRKYEIVATCGAGATLWRIDFCTAEDGRSVAHGRKEICCKISALKVLVPGVAEVGMIWRCGWNLTGTSLALCPTDCEMQVWRTDASLAWQQECTIDLKRDA